MTTSRLRSYAFGMSFAAVSLVGCGAPGQPFNGVYAGPSRDVSSSYRVLHRFGLYQPKHDPQGAEPVGGLVDVNGVLYGTTRVGGTSADAGTVFSITTAGVKKTLYRFQGGTSDGYQPGGDLINVHGTLYGTTNSGGTCGGGTVYSVSTSGAETVLHSFCGADGIYPPGASPLINVNGMLYGTTFQGGGQSSSGWGTVYRISTSGTFTVLHRFLRCDKTDPCGLATGLAYANGVFYGTSLYGGAYCHSNGGCGTVYSVTKSGKMKLLHSFKGGSDGDFPEAGLINVGGTLYGTTFLGGGHSGCFRSESCGTIYSITANGTESVLYSFSGPDGSNPASYLRNLNGTLYGETGYGGTAGYGTIFSFTVSGGEQLLHSFAGGNDGANPVGDVIELGSTLYGTTRNGGRVTGCTSAFNTGCGTVYALTP